MDRQVEVSRRHSDIDSVQYFTSQSAREEQDIRREVDKMGGLNERRKFAIRTRLRLARSFSILPSLGQSPLVKSVSKRVTSALFSDRTGILGGLVKSTSSKHLEQPTARTESHYIINKSSRRLGATSSSRLFKLNESGDLQNLLEPKKVVQTEKYLQEFNINFGNLLQVIAGNVQKRQTSRKLRQMVIKRYEKKRRLFARQQDEERKKIYGPKVERIDKKNLADDIINLKDAEKRRKV